MRACVAAAVVVATACTSPPTAADCKPEGGFAGGPANEGIPIAGDVLHIAMRLSMRCPEEGVGLKATVAALGPDNQLVPLLKGVPTRVPAQDPMGQGMSTTSAVRGE